MSPMAKRYLFRVGPALAVLVLSSCATVPPPLLLLRAALPADLRGAISSQGALDFDSQRGSASLSAATTSNTTSRGEIFSHVPGGRFDRSNRIRISNQRQNVGDGIRRPKKRDQISPQGCPAFAGRGGDDSSGTQVAPRAQGGFRAPTGIRISFRAALSIRSPYFPTKRSLCCVPVFLSSRASRKSGNRDYEIHRRPGLAGN